MEKPNLQLIDLDQEFPSINTGGIQWYSLVIRDLNRSQNVSEWFYVASCSRDNLDNPELEDAKIVDAVLMQDTPNKEELLKFAKAKFDRMNCKSWDDFYKKMREHFIYED